MAKIHCVCGAVFPHTFLACPKCRKERVDLPEKVSHRPREERGMEAYQLTDAFNEKVAKTREILQSYDRKEIKRPSAFQRLIDAGHSENMANRLLKTINH